MAGLGGLMEMGNASGRVRTGLFEIDLDSGELYKSGRKISLQDQPFRVLAMLLARPGQLVTRQELQARLWPGDTYVAFDEGLNTAIRKLRAALGDSADNPRFVETISKRGYRFIAPVIHEKTAEATAVASTHGPEMPVAPLPTAAVAKLAHAGTESERRQPQKKGGYRLRWLAVASMVAALLLVAWASRPSLPPPRVVQIRQLTRLGDLEYKIVTDGPRVYFGEGNWGAHDQIRSVSIQGGDSVPLGQIQPGSEVQSVSPDGSELLLRKGLGDLRALWRVSLPFGSPEPLDTAPVSDAAWSPDGKTIAFTDDTSVYVMKGDGSQVRKLAAFTGFPARPVWSPDGRRIRVTVTSFAGAWSILGRIVKEVDVSEGTVRSIMVGPAAQQVASLSARSVGWIGNGNYFVFTAGEAGLNNIWVVREKAAWLRRGNYEPVRLTAGPLNFPFPIAGRDGKTIFAVGEQYHGQLMRYDRKSRKFVPFLEGLPADETAFSRDGEWMAYVAYPERTLWRCHANGTDRLQLTFGPMQVGAPHWSPDGQRIAFHGESPGEAAKGFIISTNGGLAERVFPESPNGEEMLTWSDNGSQVMFVEVTASAPSRVRILDLKTRKITDVPGSAGLTGAVWSPDGRYIAAEKVENSSSELRLYDFQTGHWTTLSPWGVNVSWSADGQYLYFDSLNRYPRTADANPGFFKVRVHGGKLEKIFGVPDFNLAGFGIWVSVAPDGSPLVLKDNGTRDLYALDLDLP